MYARVTRFETAPARLGKAIAQFRTELGPTAAQLPGCRGTYLFVDREVGRGMSLTLWSSESTMRAGEEEAAKLRSDATTEQHEDGLTVWAVERYEVVVSEPTTMGSRIGPATRKTP